MGGASAALAGGALGAIGAVFIIYAFRAGGVPTYVMPLVFGGAPVVNVLLSMALHPPKVAPSPMLWVGFVLVAAGAGHGAVLQAAGIDDGTWVLRVPGTSGTRNDLRGSTFSTGTLKRTC